MSTEGKWHRILVPRGNKMSPDREMLEQYLPSNYKVMAEQTHQFVVEGRDSHGWTAEGYVIPRLASGLIVAVLA